MTAAWSVLSPWQTSRTRYAIPGRMNKLVMLLLGVSAAAGAGAGMWRGTLRPKSGEPGRPVTYAAYGPRGG